MNGKCWNRGTPQSDNVSARLIDIQIPNEVMDALYIPIDGKVFISDGGSFKAKLKLDNSEGGRELDVSFRVDEDYPTQGWWESNTKVVERTMKCVPNDILNYFLHKFLLIFLAQQNQTNCEFLSAANSKYILPQLLQINKILKFY